MIIYIMNYLLEVFNYIGQNGPLILLGILLILLFIYKSTTLFWIVFILCAINSQINYILKGIFKQPRPNFIGGPINNNHVYGMPSGHSQSSSFFTSLIIRLFKT